MTEAFKKKKHLMYNIQAQAVQHFTQLTLQFATVEGEDLKANA